MYLKQIGTLFKLIIDSEQQIERIRKQLNTLPDFDPLVLFKRIDYEQKKYIAKETLLQFLK